MPQAGSLPSSTATRLPHPLSLIYIRMCISTYLPIYLRTSYKACPHTTSLEKCIVISLFPSLFSWTPPSGRLPCPTLCSLPSGPVGEAGCQLCKWNKSFTPGARDSSSEGTFISRQPTSPPPSPSAKEGSWLLEEALPRQEGLCAEGLPLTRFLSPSFCRMVTF